MMLHCKVWHPDHPMVEVDSPCRIDAIMQAAHIWDVDLGEVLDAKVTAKKSEIDKALKEIEDRQITMFEEGGGNGSTY